MGNGSKSIAIAIVVGLAACVGAQEVGQGTFKTPEGKDVGTVTITQQGSSMAFALKLHDLPPGPRAIHIHNTGKCDPPDFASAGPHFNPANKQHGKENPQGPHAGDLPNIDIGKDGTLETTISATGLTASGDGGLLDGDGAAIVIHAGPDDYKTDPAGNAGARIACAVIEQPKR
jgi:Cu-Zn family superoxide dismutase